MHQPQQQASQQLLHDSVTRVSGLIDTWHRSRDQPGFSPAQLITEICVILEKEAENYYYTDPDPFDERSPMKANPNSILATLYKILFRWDELFVRYMFRYIILDKPNCTDVKDLTIASMRFLLTSMQAIDALNAFADNEEVVDYLYLLAEHADLPINCYAANLLGYALDSSDIVFRHRHNNNRLIPIILQRLVQLKNEMVQCAAEEPLPEDCSNSCTREVLISSIGTYSLSPLTIEVQQRLYLTYLVPMAEYQEVLAPMLECHAVQLIFDYIQPQITRDIRLTFTALRLLCAMLCHKKFSAEFLHQNGVERLLEVRRPSIASTAVSVAFYYLAYFEDSMERLCSVPEQVVTDLVEYALWLLECSHDTGRCYATMFFTHAFSFKLILDCFDRQDGLRKLYNVMSTQLILTGSEDDLANLSEDGLFTGRQIVKLVTQALRKYFEIHLMYKSEALCQHHPRNIGTLSPHPLDHGPHKTLHYSAEQMSEAGTVLLQLAPANMSWVPVDVLERLGGIQFLLRLVALSAFEWGPHNGRSDMIQNSLIVIEICCCIARNMHHLLSKLDITAEFKADGIYILLTLADNEEFQDPEVQKISLTILDSCVSRPLDNQKDELFDYWKAPQQHSLKRKSDKQLGSSSQSKDYYIHLVWKAVRTCNGIMSLLRLLETRTPLTDADHIRALACRCLLGLSRDEKINQMLAKLQLFTKGHLQLLMKEPVLPDRIRDHANFVRFANKLIERVSGNKDWHNAHATDVSLEKLRRAEIVANTKITWDGKELLQLIHNHLLSKGLTETASVLQREAELKVQDKLPTMANIYSAPLTPAPKCRQPSVCTTPNSAAPVPAKPQAHSASTANACQSVTDGGGVISPAPLRLNIVRSTGVSNISAGFCRHPGTSLGRDKPVQYNLYMQPSKSPAVSEQSLEKIISEYLLQQHAQCPKPVSTCPAFSLLEPHRCSEPRVLSRAPTSIVQRMRLRHYGSNVFSRDAAKENRRFLYSRFKPVKTFRDTEDDSTYTCCSLLTHRSRLLLGNSNGRVKCFDYANGQEICTWSVTSNSVPTLINTNESETLVAICTGWGTPASRLFRYPTEAFSAEEYDIERFHVMDFDEETFVEFDPSSRGRVVATKGYSACIYDTESKQRVATLYDAENTNDYQRNRAVFSSDGNLVLNDGVLWDVRAASRCVNKFDKFQSVISGVFHPNNLEIVISSEVWDLRSFRLLNTVASLEQVEIQFTKDGDAIFGANFFWDDDELHLQDPVNSSMWTIFRTLDARDYSLIASIDLKRRIRSMSISTHCDIIAVCESTPTDETLGEELSAVRLYQIGQRKEVEEERGMDEDTEDENEPDRDETIDEDDESGDIHHLLQDEGALFDNDANNIHEDEMLDLAEELIDLQEGSDEASDSVASSEEGNEDEEDDDDDEEDNIDEDDTDQDEDDADGSHGEEFLNDPSIQRYLRS